MTEIRIECLLQSFGIEGFREIWSAQCDLLSNKGLKIGDSDMREDNNVGLLAFPFEGFCSDIIGSIFQCPVTTVRGDPSLRSM